METWTVVKQFEEMARKISRSRGPDEIHPGQWAVLRFIARSTQQGASVSCVASHLGVTHGPASRAVASLAARGLVNVAADPNDRRSRRLSVAEAGQILLANDPMLRLRSAIGTLSASQKSELFDLLNIVFLALGDTK
ncbi:MAG: MarR family transcriptional regulator [Alphaproteobacteria bacterium]